jgi:hypothetical protein
MIRQLNLGECTAAERRRHFDKPRAGPVGIHKFVPLESTFAWLFRRLEVYMRCLLLPVGNSLGSDLVDPNRFGVVSLNSQLAEAGRGLMFKKFSAVALAASMLVSSTAFAAANANQGALTQGGAATVKQAQSYSDREKLWWILGAGIIIGGIVLVSGGDGHGVIGATTTCPFSGCPVTPPTTTTTTTTTTSTP